MLLSARESCLCTWRLTYLWTADLFFLLLYAASDWRLVILCIGLIALALESAKLCTTYHSWELLCRVSSFSFRTVCVYAASNSAKLRFDFDYEVLWVSSIFWIITSCLYVISGISIVSSMSCVWKISINLSMCGTYRISSVSRIFWIMKSCDTPQLIRKDHVIRRNLSLSVHWNVMNGIDGLHLMYLYYSRWTIGTSGAFLYNFTDLSISLSMYYSSKILTHLSNYLIWWIFLFRIVVESRLRILHCLQNPDFVSQLT